MAVQLIEEVDLGKAVLLEVADDVKPLLQDLLRLLVLVDVADARLELLEPLLGPLDLALKIAELHHGEDVEPDEQDREHAPQGAEDDGLFLTGLLFFSGMEAG